MRRVAYILPALLLLLAPCPPPAFADPGDDDDGWLEDDASPPETDSDPVDDGDTDGDGDPPEDGGTTDEDPPAGDGGEPVEGETTDEDETPGDDGEGEEPEDGPVTITLLSEPPGAAVFRYGEPLGVTPLQIELERDAVVEEWQLYADGYEPFDLRVDLARSADIDIALTPEGGVAPADGGEGDADGDAAGGPSAQGGEGDADGDADPEEGDADGDGGGASGDSGADLIGEVTLDPEASALYDKALSALLERRFRAAERLFVHFVERYPDDPRVFTAEELTRVAQYYGATGGAVSAGGMKDEIGEDKTGLGGIEFVTTSTLFGIWSGIAWSLASDLEEGSILLTSLTGLTGLGLSLWYAFSEPIDSAQSALLTNGIALGTWNAIAIQFATDIDLESCTESDFDFNCRQYAPLVYWVAGAAGLGIAALVGASFDITPGQVSLANSGAIWGTFTAGMMVLIVNGDDSLSDRALFGSLLAGTNVGFAGMAIASPWMPTSRGRQALIDLGGLLGGLLSLGIVAVSDLTESPRATGVVMLLGAGGGIALTAWLTDGMEPDASDDEELEDEATLLPPTPFLIGQQGRDGRAGFAAGVNVLNMTF